MGYPQLFTGPVAITRSFSWEPYVCDLSAIFIVCPCSLLLHQASVCHCFSLFIRLTHFQRCEKAEQWQLKLPCDVFLLSAQCLSNNGVYMFVLMQYFFLNLTSLKVMLSPNLAVIFCLLVVHYSINKL